MKKNYAVLFAIGLILLIAVLTNPNLTSTSKLITELDKKIYEIVDRGL